MHFIVIASAHAETHQGPSNIGAVAYLYVYIVHLIA